MIEYWVELKGGPALVYADTFVVLGGCYQFYLGDKVVKQFAVEKVVSVHQTVVKGGVAHK